MLKMELSSQKKADNPHMPCQSHQHKTEKPYLQMQQKVTFRFGNILPCRKNFVNLRASVIMYFWNRLSRLFYDF